MLLLPILMFIYMTCNQYTDYYTQERSVNLGLWGEAIDLNPTLSMWFAVLLTLFNAVVINWIYNINEFLERNSYIPSLLYIVLMSFYHSFYNIDGLLLAHTCLIIMLHHFFRLRQNEDSRSIVFNGAFFAGIAATLHPPMVTLLPVVFFMVWSIRPFVGREFLLMILGFVVPLLYAGAYLFYSDHVIELRILEQATNYYKKQTDFLVTSVLFTLLFLLSIVSIRTKMLKSSSRLKKMVRMLWWLIGVGVLFGLVDFIFFRQIERFSFLMIPLSFFLTFSFTNKTVGLTATVLFYVTLIYSLVNFFI